MDWTYITAKTVSDAITEATIKLGTSSDNLEYEVIEKASSGFLGLFNNKPAKIKARCKFSIEGVTRHFLERLFLAMNIQASIDLKYDEVQGTVDINISGNEMGVLIGKRGQTLDSLQYLTSLVVNKESSSYLKVKIDTENYRERRRETLQNLAKNIAYKVKRTKKSVSLEPMNPYERRVIHSTLQNDKFVETHSEGEEPYRRVVVSLKRYNKEYKKDYSKKEYNKESSI
ncbi:RNA-binding cell elongation regulator Jag/EloR [Anaeromicropila herbilytica]|nr:RNA-binding cell elongation regulator Jag/EloR [Anaeromicropila herbilytica]